MESNIQRKAYDLNMHRLLSEPYAVDQSLDACHMNSV